MVTVGEEVVLRGVVEESVPWGTVNNVRVRLANGNDIWVDDQLIASMAERPLRAPEGAPPEYVAKSDVEKLFDGLGQRGELPAEVADHLKRLVILGPERAGPAPARMANPQAGGKSTPGTGASPGILPESEVREREKLAERRRVEAPYSSPGRSPRDMGHTEVPPTLPVPAGQDRPLAAHETSDPTTGHHAPPRVMTDGPQATPPGSGESTPGAAVAAAPATVPTVGDKPDQGETSGPEGQAPKGDGPKPDKGGKR